MGFLRVDCEWAGGNAYANLHFIKVTGRSRTSQFRKAIVVLGVLAIFEVSLRIALSNVGNSFSRTRVLACEQLCQNKQSRSGLERRSIEFGNESRCARLVGLILRECSFQNGLFVLDAL